MYLGAITLLPRAILGISMFFILAFIMKLALIGHDLEQPTRGLRKAIIHFNVEFWCRLLSYVAFFTHLKFEMVKEEEVNFYEEYLGPAAQQIKVEKHVSMIVCNHVGWYEILALLSCPLKPSIAGKAELENVPALGTIMRAIECMFIKRGGSQV